MSYVVHLLLIALNLMTLPAGVFSPLRGRPVSSNHELLAS